MLFISPPTPPKSLFIKGRGTDDMSKKITALFINDHCWGGRFTREDPAAFLNRFQVSRLHNSWEDEGILTSNHVSALGPSSLSPL